jgi:hypothetical protein
MYSSLCEKWNLKVNTNKSKVMFFSKGRLPINFNLKMNNMELEIVSEFIPFLLVKKVSKSFRYSANRNGYKFSPCVTPLKHGKTFEAESL